MENKMSPKGYILIMLFFFVSYGMSFGQTGICGDINENGEVNIIDALLIAQCYVGITGCAGTDISDVDCNGSVNIIDALLVAQYYVRILSQLDCCGAPPAGTPVPDLHLRCSIEFNPAIYPSSFHYPQFSIWIKDTATGTLYSLYVTNFSAGLSESSNNYRPYALPVWFGERVKEKAQPSYPDIDAISSATPLVENKTFTWQIQQELVNRDLEVCLEGNMSYDYNDYYTFVPNGQPSLIWMSVMNSQNTILPVEPQVIGHGDLLGEDNLIHTEGMAAVTDARDIFRKIEFEFYFTN